MHVRLYFSLDTTTRHNLIFFCVVFQRTDFEETGNIQKAETKTRSSSIINPDL